MKLLSICEDSGGVSAPAAETGSFLDEGISGESGEGTTNGLSRKTGVSSSKKIEQMTKSWSKGKLLFEITFCSFSLRHVFVVKDSLVFHLLLCFP